MKKHHRVGLGRKGSKRLGEKQEFLGLPSIFSTACESVMQVGAQGCEGIVNVGGPQGANRLDGCMHA